MPSADAAAAQLALLQARAATPGESQLEALQASGRSHRLRRAPEPEPEPEPEEPRCYAPPAPEQVAQWDEAADRLAQRVASGGEHRRQAAAAARKEREAVRQQRAKLLPEEWARAEATEAREREALSERREAERAAAETRRLLTEERVAGESTARAEAARTRLTEQERLDAERARARAASFKAAAADADAATARLSARIAQQAEDRAAARRPPVRTGPLPPRSSLAELTAAEREQLIYTLSREDLMKLMEEAEEGEDGESHQGTGDGEDA